MTKKPVLKIIKGPLNGQYVGYGGFLFKEVFWISVGQLAAKLQVVKVGGKKKSLPPGQSRTTRRRPGFDSQTIGFD